MKRKILITVILLSIMVLFIYSCLAIGEKKIDLLNQKEIIQEKYKRAGIDLEEELKDNNDLSYQRSIFTRGIIIRCNFCT